jgi:hypothetical protein
MIRRTLPRGILRSTTSWPAPGRVTSQRSAGTGTPSTWNDQPPGSRASAGSASRTVPPTAKSLVYSSVKLSGFGSARTR